MNITSLQNGHIFSWQVQHITDKLTSDFWIAKNLLSNQVIGRADARMSENRHFHLKYLLHKSSFILDMAGDITIYISLIPKLEFPWVIKITFIFKIDMNTDIAIFIT